MTRLKVYRLVLGALLAMASFGIAAQTAAIEQRLEKALRDLGFADGKLPALKPAFGNYVDSVRVGNLLFLSSAAPQKPDGQFFKGRVPDQVSVDQAVVAAKLACVRQVNRMKLVLGDLGKVKRIVFVKGKVLAQADFADHTKIIDGCSAFLVEVFGDAGKHARTTDGIISAPFGVTVEVETIIEVSD
jgi:enamine deaminase RidA (YjgF/YER057c/UK114 family)